MSRELPAICMYVPNRKKKTPAKPKFCQRCNRLAEFKGVTLARGCDMKWLCNYCRAVDTKRIKRITGQTVHVEEDGTWNMVMMMEDAVAVGEYLDGRMPKHKPRESKVVSIAESLCEDLKNEQDDDI